MRKRIACITLDIEPDLRDPQRRVRMLEDAALLERYVAIIQAHQVKVTGFLVTSLIEPYGRELEQLSRRIPIEFAVHSHDHDTRRACSREQVERAMAAHEAFWGSAPLGYRAPNGLLNPAGVGYLMDCGFQYDSSIVPSVRLDEHAYWNLRFPREPFRFARGRQSLVELPCACLRGVRLGLSLSYAKVLGLRFYRLLAAFFPLPSAVVLGSHPYDFYVSLIAQYLKGWKKHAHLSNAQQASRIFEQIIDMLRQQGYEFAYMSDLNHYVREMPDVPSIPLQEWP